MQAARRVRRRPWRRGRWPPGTRRAPVPEAPDGGDYSLGIGGAGLIGLFGATLIIVGFYVRRKAAARI